MNKKKILIAEDDKSLRENVFEYLDAEDQFEMMKASDGAEALKIYEKNRDIDLVLLDEDMPFIKGSELARLIKKQSPHIKTVSISANKGIDKTYFDYHLPKLFSLDNLLFLLTTEWLGEN